MINKTVATLTMTAIRASREFGLATKALREAISETAQSKMYNMNPGNPRLTHADNALWAYSPLPSTKCPA